MASELMTAAATAAKARSLCGAWKAKALLKILGELDTLDRGVENRKDKGSRLFKGGIVGLIVAAVLLFVVPILGFTLLVLAAGAIWIGNRMKSEATVSDLANEVRLTIAPLLQRLVGDLDPNQKIRVRLDLRAIDPNKPDVSPPATGRRKIWFFTEPLGSLRMPLANGDTIVLRIRNRYKRSVSEHARKPLTKTKEKWKKSAKVTAILIPNKPIAASRAPISDAKLGSIRFYKSGGITTARLDRQISFASGVRRPPTGLPPAETISAGDLMSMLVRLSAVARQGQS